MPGPKVLESWNVNTGANGRIVISDGAIVHAERGPQQGEGALYSLLALRGGAFNLAPFTEPAKRTIAGQWEFLLMEAARMRDEAEVAAPESAPESAPDQAATATVAPAESPGEPAAEGRPQIQETLLCSGAGEVLFHSRCANPAERRQLLDRLDDLGRELGALAPLGRFERLEVCLGTTRIVCLIQPDRRLLVRSANRETRALMKAAIEALLRRCEPLAGVAAWRAYLVDQPGFGQCYTDWFRPDQLDRVLRCLVTTSRNTKGLEIRAGRLCWTFDRARVYLVLRTDGTGLALFTENRPGPAPAEWEAVLEEFAQLPG